MKNYFGKSHVSEKWPKIAKKAKKRPEKALKKPKKAQNYKRARIFLGHLVQDSSKQTLVKMGIFLIEAIKKTRALKSFPYLSYTQEILMKVVLP